MELILYEYTESMKNRLEGGYILPGQTDMIHGIESIYAGLEKDRTPAVVGAGLQAGKIFRGGICAH